jgi:ribosomal protein L40E
MGETFSAGFGLAMGLIMGQCMLQTTSSRKVMVNQVIICQNCAGRNPIEHKFCSSCGQSLYPPPQIECQKCKADNPATMNFCGYCGSLLK